MGWKTVETRGHNRFTCLVGRRVAIHASKQWDPSSLDVAGEFLSPTQIAAHGQWASRWGTAFGYPAGQIVALATMIGVRECTHPELAAAALCWYEGRTGYVLSDIDPLPRGLRVEGSQGIFFVELPSLWVKQLPLPLLSQAATQKEATPA